MTQKLTIRQTLKDEAIVSFIFGGLPLLIGAVVQGVSGLGKTMTWFEPAKYASGYALILSAIGFLIYTVAQKRQFPDWALRIAAELIPTVQGVFRVLAGGLLTFSVLWLNFADDDCCIAIKCAFWGMLSLIFSAGVIYLKHHLEEERDRLTQREDRRSSE